MMMGTVVQGCVQLFYMYTKILILPNQHKNIKVMAQGSKASRVSFSSSTKTVDAWLLYWIVHFQINNFLYDHVDAKNSMENFQIYLVLYLGKIWISNNPSQKFSVYVL